MERIKLNKTSFRFTLSQLADILELPQETIIAWMRLPEEKRIPHSVSIVPDPDKRLGATKTYIWFQKRSAHTWLMENYPYLAELFIKEFSRIYKIPPTALPLTSPFFYKSHAKKGNKNV
jgi:hypothetical protein